MVKLPFGKKDGNAPGSKPAKATTRYPFVGAPLSPSWKVVDKYPLNAPFAYAVIAEDPGSGTRKYFVDEVNLSPREASIYTYLLDTLESELSVPRSEIDPRAYFLEQAKRLVKKYSIKASQLSWPKINYFAERDLVGFGIIDGVMRDTQIEDITVDGVGKPLFIFHRRYDNIETNMNFLHDEELDNVIARLAHMAGKHVSTAFPIVQGTLPGRHRLAATYRREISPYGGTLTIRKFREDPLTITGSGKTTLLNALLTLTRMNSKIVTIEEVQEINIAHQNWSALVSRESYGTGDDTSGEVGLFQLVKATMRMRPDILVVGEVRGEEAYVLFQAISTGHGGLCLPPWESLPVVVDGRPTLTTIGELYDGQSEASETLHVQGQDIAYPKSELLVPSYDVAENKATLSRVKRISRRHFDGKLLTIHTVGGTDGTVTQDHPILVLRDGKISRICAKDAKIGDLVPSADELPMVGTSSPPEQIDLIDELMKSPAREKVIVKSVRDLLYGQTKGQLAALLGVRDRTIDDYRKKDYIPLQKYLLLKDENHDRRFLRYRKSPHAIPAILQLNRAFARLIGFYLAEGSAGPGKVDLSFNTNETEFIKEVADSLSRSFGVPVAVVNTGENSTQVVAKDKLLSLIFTTVLRAGNDSYSKRVPDVVFRMRPELMKEVLDTYFLGDGCGFEGADGRVGCLASTSSEQLAHGVYYTMLLTGYHVLVGKDKRNDSWKLTVAGGENLRRFVENFSLGSSLRGKINKGDPGLVEKVPIEYVLSRGSHYLLRTRSNEGNRFISKQVLDRLNLPRPNGVYFTEITQITSRHYNGYVYDLYEVEKTHNFVHGFGLITSNCTLHADDVTSAIQRLTSKPMDVPPSFIPFLDLVFTVRRIAIPLPGGSFKTMRRVLSVDEVVSVGNYVRMFKWDPGSDKQMASPMKTSVKLARLARDTGTTVPELMSEIERRSIILRWAQQRDIRNFRELSLIFEEYRSHSKEMFERAREDLGKAGLVMQTEIGEGFKV